MVSALVWFFSEVFPMIPWRAIGTDHRETFSMTLTFTSLTLEITRGHLYVDLAGRSAVFIEIGTGLPWSDFARQRSGNDLELWGLGMHAVVSRKEPGRMTA